MGILERIRDIEAEMARTQKNKATEVALFSIIYVFFLLVPFRPFESSTCKIEVHNTFYFKRIFVFRSELLKETKSTAKGGGGDGFDVSKFET